MDGQKQTYEHFKAEDVYKRQLLLYHKNWIDTVHWHLEDIRLLQCSLPLRTFQ